MTALAWQVETDYGSGDPGMQRYRCTEVGGATMSSLPAWGGRSAHGWWNLPMRLRVEERAVLSILACDRKLLVKRTPRIK